MKCFRGDSRPTPITVATPASPLNEEEEEEEMESLLTYPAAQLTHQESTTSSSATGQSSPQRTTTSNQGVLSFGQHLVYLALLFLSIQAAYIYILLDDSGAHEQNPSTPSNNTSEALYFYRNPKHFVDLFEDCIMDDFCHIYYHHGKKTGRSTIAYQFSTLMNYTSYSNDDWCCSHMLKRFRADQMSLCSMPFMPAEVTGEQFQTMVQTCMALLNSPSKPSANKRHRAIVWTSIREPIQRTVSMINQKCNKNCRNKKKCSSSLKDACKRCDYSSDILIWDGFVQDTNRVYREIQMVTKMQLNNTHIVSIDTSDISQFFSMMHNRLPNLNIDNSAKVRNPEKDDHCSFAMMSGQFRDLTPSEAIYRNVTMGLRR